MKSLLRWRSLREIEARQRGTVWPDTLRNGALVDAFLWKGSPKATVIQRIGPGLFELKPGDRRNVPQFLMRYATEVRVSWRESDADLLGRPPFLGITGRDVASPETRNLDKKTRGQTRRSPSPHSANKAPH